jgi:hypothetical protein
MLVDPQSGRLIASRVITGHGEASEGDVIVAFGSLWVLTQGDAKPIPGGPSIDRLNPVTLQVEANIDIYPWGGDISATNDALWVVGGKGAVPIDPDTNSRQPAVLLPERESPTLTLKTLPGKVLRVQPSAQGGGDDPSTLTTTRDRVFLGFVSADSEGHVVTKVATIDAIRRRIIRTVLIGRGPHLSDLAAQSDHHFLAGLYSRAGCKRSTVVAVQGAKVGPRRRAGSDDIVASGGLGAWGLCLWAPSALQRLAPDGSVLASKRVAESYFLVPDGNDVYLVQQDRILVAHYRHN